MTGLEEITDKLSDVHVVGIPYEIEILSVTRVRNRASATSPFARVRRLIDSVTAQYLTHYPNEMDEALPAIDLATNAKAASIEVGTKSLSQLVSDVGSTGLERIPALGHKVVTS